MKKIVSWILLVLMITLLLSSCAKGDIAPEGSDMTSLPIVTEKPQETPAVPEETAVPEEPDEETPGEWGTADSPVLTEERTALFGKGFNGLLGVNYIPLAYLGSQVIFGTVHTFLARATVVVPGASETYALVYLYEELDGSVRIIDICRSGIATEMDGSGRCTPAEDPTLTDELKEAFSSAVSGMLGVDYEPVALCGTKIGNGLEFVIIAESTPVVPDAETGYSFITLTRENSADFTVSDIVEFKVDDNQPSAPPTPSASPSPTAAASPSPSPTVTASPSPSPTASAAPTEKPSAAPTEKPTAAPTEKPTAAPTEKPTAVPTEEPTPVPTEEPTPVPTEEPTPVPAEEPTPVPTEKPAPIPTEESAGKWEKASSPVITDKIKALFGKVASSTVGVRYNPIAYIGSQKVNGTNYAVLCETSMSAPNSQDLYSIVYLYEDSEGKVIVTDIVMSEVRTYTDLVMGGWTTAEDSKVTDKQASMLSAALKKRLGATYSPIALLSTQSASGINYCFFCEAGKVTADPSAEYAFVYVNENGEGTAEVYEILDFISE